MIAPFPACDSAELSLTFVATTFAKILSPTVNKYGDAVSVERGTVHYVLDIIALSPPSQLVLSSV